jgi:hypothetical protein
MVNHPLIKKLMCVAVVVAAILPVGWFVYPHVANAVSGMQFNTIEAVLAATLGLGLYTSIFS